MHFWDRHKTITGYYESLTSSICDKYDLTQMESAKSIIYEGVDTQKRFAHDVLKGFSDEEIATFKNIFEKICNNAEDCLNKKQHRECQLFEIKKEF